MDLLQEKIRKLKCAVVVDFSIAQTHIPPQLESDYAAFCRQLMEGLAEEVPGVRFHFDQFALMEGGLEKLQNLLKMAAELGYFVIVDGPQILSPWAAQQAADGFFGEGSAYPCDCLVLSPYIGSDAIRPFLPYCKEQGKSVFFAVRTPNKSAAQVQDMMSGTRLVHTAVAEIVNRDAVGILGKCGYSRLGIVAAGNNGAATATLRSKYDRMFLLVDGFDYPGGNAKTCSAGFDRLGHGAAVSVGPAILGAWAGSDGADFVEKTRQAVKQMNRNLKNYVTIL